MRVTDPGSDLALVLAVRSAVRNEPIPSGLVAIGEVGLSGEVRPVPGVQRRLAEAARLGFTAAVIPLLVLLVLQYLWLAKLQETSAIAHTAYLGHYLESVASRIRYHYRAIGERSLNLPASLFEEFDPEEIAKHFNRKPIKGAREVFVLQIDRGPWNIQIPRVVDHYFGYAAAGPFPPGAAAFDSVFYFQNTPYRWLPLVKERIKVAK